MARRARRGRHEGGCFQRSSDGLWVASKSAGTDPRTGKRLRLTAYGTTKQSALERLDELKRQATSGTLPDARLLTVGELLAKWLDNSRGRCAPRTVAEREKLVRTHLAPRLGRHRLDKLHALHVESFYSELRNDGVKAGAVHSAARALTTALNYATKLRLIPYNPAAGVAKPAGPGKDIVVLDPPQASALTAVAKTDPYGPLVLTALGTGLRIGELLALTWDDIDLKANALTVSKAVSYPKGGAVVKPPKTAASRRTVTLPPFVVAALVAHKAAAMRAGLLGKPAFCSGTGGYRRPGDVWAAFNKLVKRVNASMPADGSVKRIPAGLSFHGLRHSHASLLLSAGHSLRAVAHRLGHGNPALTLKIYAHCLPLDDAKLADGIGAIVAG